VIGAQPRKIARGLTEVASGPVELRAGVGKIPFNTWVSEFRQPVDIVASPNTPALDLDF
jgi:hypothetical protein